MSTRQRISALIREAAREVSAQRRRTDEDAPCWDDYTMVGTKTKGGDEVPNCVPDDDVDDYDVNEMTTTMAVPGYSTPFAFKKNDEDEEEQLDERLRTVNSLLEYTDRSDLTSEEALRDFARFFTPYMERNRRVAEAIKNAVLRPVTDIR